MALVTQVSNLRTYNLKFSDFGIDQAVEQPIPVEPGRTVSTGTVRDIVTDTLDLQVGRRKDDVTRLTAFLTSGKGVTFASKQAGLGQDLSLELNPRKRLTAAANTAARLANILTQAAASNSGLRFSSNPFGRYIEARGFVGQIGNLLKADAPSLAKRGRTIIPDYEVQDQRARAIDEQNRTRIGQFFNDNSFFRRVSTLVKRGADFYNNVKDLNSLANNVDGDPASLKSTLNADGSKFDSPNRNPYLERELPESREGFTGRLINDITVEDSLDPNLSRPISDNEVNSSFSQLNNGFREGEITLDITSDIRTSYKGARRDGSGNFIASQPYRTFFYELEEPFNINVSNIKIEIFTPNVPEGPTLTVIFDAYIDSFSDSYTGNWNSTNYIGRAEPVYNYTGFNRDYSFNFKVAALSAGRLQDLYQRLNVLAGTTAPTYSGTFMRGTFVRLKIGDYLDLTPGFISSIGFSWNTTYPWQAQKDEKFITTDGGGNTVEGEYDNLPLVPHVLDVSCNFTPIHNFIPQTNTDLNVISSPYIASTDLLRIPEANV